MLITIFKNLLTILKYHPTRNKASVMNTATSDKLNKTIWEVLSKPSETIAL